MTTATAKTTSTKATSTPVKDVEVEKVKEPARIPELLSENHIFGNFCERYLGILDKITAYNKEVLAEKDAEWNPSKVIEKARLFANPTEKGVEPNKEIQNAMNAWEDLAAKAIQARKKVMELTAKELGITLSNTSERNSETEAPLKEERKIALTIGDQLNTMGELSQDDKFTEAINVFLSNNPMPAIGRDQVRTFGDNAKATPKYRVNVTVTKDDEELLIGDGFTKTALALTQSKFGYERGKALDAAKLRDAWEKVGNTPEKTVQPVVEFTDNGLVFNITKK